MAITQYYVDPAIAGNSGTGTVGDPYGDLQYALNTITRNATDGDQINVKAGTAEVLAAALSLTTYGSPAAVAPLILRGYTSAAGDGGIGAISGNGSYAILAGSTNDYIHLIDLRLTNVGSNVAVALRNYCSVQNCEVDTGTSRGIDFSGPGTIEGCYIHDFSSFGVYSLSGNIIRNCYVHTCGSYLIALSGPNGEANANVLRPVGAATGIILNALGTKARANTVFGSNGTGKGIEAAASLPAIVCTNNIVVGFSGAGGVGISVPSTCVMSQYHSNAAYNNTTNYSVSAKFLGITGNNDTLAALPFVDAANGDFDINGTQAGVTDDAWPTSFLGIANTTPKADKGAVQAGAGAGGGRPAFGDRTGGKW